MIFIIIFFISIIICYILYTIAPNYYMRNMSTKIQHTLITNNKDIVLTFDDGPDEKYTERILDILKEYNVKATFFIVAKKVPNNIHIIKRMKKEGHVIALHSLKHKSAWLMGPVESKKEIPEALQILNKYGIKVELFRPPWGTFNIFTAHQAIKYNMKIVLWSVEAYDWRRTQTPQKISNLLLNRTQNGSIIVLHDSGGAKNAPDNTIEALKITIPQLLSRGYKFVKL